MRVNTHTSTHTNTQTNKKTFKTWNHFQKQIKKCIECLRWLVVSILFLTLIKLTWLKFCEKPLNFWTFFAKIKCLNCFFSWNMHGRNCACESVVLFLKVWLENTEKKLWNREIGCFKKVGDEQPLVSKLQAPRIEQGEYSKLWTMQRTEFTVAEIQFPWRKTEIIISRAKYRLIVRNKNQ